MRDLAELYADLRSASPTQHLVRAVIGLGTALLVLALTLSGHANPVMLLGILALGALTVLHPHTLAPALVIMLAAGGWFAVVPGWHWSLVIAVWGVLLVHTAAALAASVPAQADLPAGVLRRWATRVAAVGLASTALYAVAGLVGSLASPAGGAIPGLIGLAAVVVGLVLLVRWWGET